MVRNGTRSLRGLGALAFVAVACLRATPFESDPSAHDRTRTNLEALAQRTPGPTFKFVALGCTHDEYDDLARTIDVINARDDIELVLVAGDMSDRGMLTELEWSRALFDRLRVPYLTAVGNHDAIGSGKQIYTEMYGPFDYRFRFGGVEFIVFNSNSLEFPGEPVPNFTWLHQQLSAASDARATVLVTHHPPYFPPNEPEGSYPATAYEQLFAQERITLFVNAHLKNWGLWTNHGSTQLQCGTFQVNRFHTVVTIDNANNVSFERCQFDSCEPVRPEQLPGARL